MSRLLSLAALVALIVLVFWAAPSDKAHSVSHADQLGAPTAVSMPSGLVSLPDAKSALPSTAPGATTLMTFRVSISLAGIFTVGDPHTTVSVLRI